MRLNRIVNIIGISVSAIGILIGLSVHWAPGTWLSVAALVMCLIAAPSIWRRT